MRACERKPPREEGNLNLLLSVQLQYTDIVGRQAYRILGLLDAAAAAVTRDTVQESAFRAEP